MPVVEPVMCTELLPQHLPDVPMFWLQPTALTPGLLGVMCIDTSQRTAQQTEGC